MTDLTKVINHVGRAASRRYADWVDPEDVTQELHVYALGFPDMFQKWEQAGETMRTFRTLYGVAKQYCENEKAQKSGYDFSDIAWYAPTTLADLVPLALNPLWDGLASDPTEPGMPRAKSDGSSGNSLMTMVLDVRRVLDQEKPRYGGWDIDTVHGEENLTWLADKLGGEYPDAPGYSRTRRKAQPNGAAITQTTIGY